MANLQPVVGPLGNVSLGGVNVTGDTLPQIAALGARTHYRDEPELTEEEVEELLRSRGL